MVDFCDNDAGEIHRDALSRTELWQCCGGTMIALAGVASEATFVSTASDDDEEEVGTVIDPARPTTLTNTATAPTRNILIVR